MKRRKAGGRRKHTMQGTGFWGDLWDGIKSVAGPINSVLKSTGIAGNLASAYNPTAGAAVKALGYGRRQTGGRRGAKKVVKF